MKKYGFMLKKTGGWVLCRMYKDGEAIEGGMTTDRALAVREMEALQKLFRSEKYRLLEASE